MESSAAVGPGVLGPTALGADCGSLREWRQFDPAGPLQGRSWADRCREGGEAHLLDMLTLNQRVRGSSPRRPTNKISKLANPSVAHYPS